MELIEKYIYAVGKRLPKKQRSDIEKELESSIYDSLEDNFGKCEEYTFEQVSIVLKQFGPPWKVAAGYQKNSGYLIGPELINTYYMIIKIVAGAVSLGLFVSFVIGLFKPELTLGSFLLQMLEFIPSVFLGIITAIGFVTVIFYIIEKKVPEYKLNDICIDAEWNPKDLPEVPKEKAKIPIGDSVAGIIFTIIAIIIFNLYVADIGVYYTPSWGEGWHFVQIFSIEATQTYLPFWNIVWGISLIFHIFCLIQRQWNIKTRLFDIFISLLNVGVLIMMIKGPEWIDVRSLLNNASDGVVEALTPVAEFLKYSIDGILIFILVLTIIGLIVKAVKFFSSIVSRPTAG